MARQKKKAVTTAAPTSYRRRTRQQTRLARSVPFPLLSLPVELRHTILKNLLLSPTPLRTERRWQRDTPRHRPHIHVAILRTCKQLFEEGTPILALNTIAGCVNVHNGSSIYYTKHGMTTNDLPAIMRISLTKLSMDIYVQDSVQTWDVAHHMRAFGRILRKTPNWQDLTFTFQGDVSNTRKDRSMERDWKTKIETIFRPLQYCRGYKQVTMLHSPDEEVTSAIIRRMTSSEPIIDLEAAYDAAHQHIEQLRELDNIPRFRGSNLENHMQYPHVDDGTAELRIAVGILDTRLWQCRDDCKVDEFVALRNRLMRLGVSILLKRQAQLLQYDTPGTKPSFTLGSIENTCLPPPDKEDTTILARVERELYYFSESWQK